jgi:transcriptional regulator with XRE-family HTH domain
MKEIVRRRGGNRGKTDGEPNLVDVHVGRRIRLRRSLLEMSQSDLGKELGLTFQQVQKYERGDNRVSASRLFDIARVLDVTISFFFDDLPEELLAEFTPVHPYVPEAPGRQFSLDAEGEELARAYYEIADPAVRAQFYMLVKVLGDSSFSAEAVQELMQA